MSAQTVCQQARKCSIHLQSLKPATLKKNMTFMYSKEKTSPHTHTISIRTVDQTSDFK